MWPSSTPDVANDLTNDPEWKAVKQNVDPEDWYKAPSAKFTGLFSWSPPRPKNIPGRAAISAIRQLWPRGGSGDADRRGGVSGKTITLREELTAEDVTYLGSKKIQINGF